MIVCNQRMNSQHACLNVLCKCNDFPFASSFQWVFYECQHAFDSLDQLKATFHLIHYTDNIGFGPKLSSSHKIIISQTNIVQMCHWIFTVFSSQKLSYKFEWIWTANRKRKPKRKCICPNMVISKSWNNFKCV